MKKLKLTPGYFVDSWQTEVITGHILEIPDKTYISSINEDHVTTCYYFTDNNGESFVKTYGSKVFTDLKRAEFAAKFEKLMYTEYLTKEVKNKTEELKKLNITI